MKKIRVVAVLVICLLLIECFPPQPSIAASHYGGLGKNASRKEVDAFLTVAHMSMSQFLNPNEASTFHKKYGMSEEQFLQTILYGYAIMGKVIFHVTYPEASFIANVSKAGGLRPVTISEALADCKFAALTALSQAAPLVYATAWDPPVASLPIINRITAYTVGTDGNMYARISMSHHPLNSRWKRAFGSFAIVFSYYFDETLFGREVVPGIPSLPYPIFRKTQHNDSISYGPMLTTVEFSDGVSFSGSYIGIGSYGYQTLMEVARHPFPYLHVIKGDSLVGLLKSWNSIYKSVKW
ncbi:hypothetical protein [Ferroacidibacillus organovorans]|uniref:SLH domain-containing protein n=1 Tax=Ferroacidibacillus organovorans TaxID=1765683 RepID=A0A853KAR2_9BACL|nr:hypothetical protein [Ferroacidibacillus organovorans]KYP81647.1 hypothetical protein AYJ22_06360 [Ferroacidibacillus organovorans]OAG94155.1 hypothetical protein AYW79_06960 [Ferroacidibacillus organovorans]